MNTTILQKNIQEFIRNYKGDVTTLAFKGSPFDEVPTAELIGQIEGYQKTEKKLPSWHEKEGVYYPKKLNLEQCSSEITARYKASLVSGNTLVDITGGYGVDAFYFASHFEKVYHFERDEYLSNIAQHNFGVLGKSNITTQCIDGIEGVQKNYFDVIYMDPARRHAAKGKVFFLKDCEPDIVANLELLFEHGQQILLKASPMLDISAALKDLNKVSEIHIVAVENEVKELLFLMKKNHVGDIAVITKNFNNKGSQSFTLLWESIPQTDYSLPKKYLYEPNAAIMKVGNFGGLGHSFNLDKLHPNSHLFTSDDRIDFPGRSFEIMEAIPYNKRNMSTFKNTKGNVAIRNFPESVAVLRKKWRIADGGDSYLFFTTNKNEERVVLICKKLMQGTP